MAEPLFTEAELKEYEASDRPVFNAEMRRRAQLRAEEFLNGLIIRIGKRGHGHQYFDAFFSHSDSLDMKEMLSVYDVPETRRALHTILKALIEVPRSWGPSALVRFLRGIGKQSGLKYYGAGMFGVRYGWTAKEITGVCSEIANGRAYYSGFSEVLMSYEDVEDKVRKACEAREIEKERKLKESKNANPDFEIIDEDSDTRSNENLPYGSTRAVRDIEFLNKLCSLLETKGLGSLPVPQPEKPKKLRKPKIFKSGDVIRCKDLRDLPLPAYVRIEGMSRKDRAGEWIKATIEQVVVSFYSGGYGYYSVGPDGKAYSGGYNHSRKEWLDKATYLGPWKGPVSKKELRYKFEFQLLKHYLYFIRHFATKEN